MDEEPAQSLHGLHQPAELQLRALVDFLSVDPRPTAILHALDDVKTLPIYYNPAFQNLPRSSEEFKHLHRALADALRSETDAVPLHGRLLEGKRWEARRTGDYYTVVAVDGVGVAARPPEALAEQGKKQDHNGNAAERDIFKDMNDRGRYDWTRSDLPALTPWTKFMRGFNWASTSVGPMATWHPLLRQCVLSMTANPSPRLIVWGEEMTMIYNEACVQQFSEKHPSAMGQHVAVQWAEIWPWLSPVLEAVYRGETVKLSEQPLTIERNGFSEDTFWDSTLLPIFSPDGHAIGVFDELTEVTSQVTGERRRKGIHQLSVHISSSSTVNELWTSMLKTFEGMATDVPFALFYAVVDDVSEIDRAESTSTSTDSCSTPKPKCAKLIGTAGLPEDHPDVISRFALLDHLDTGPGIVQPCLQAWRTREAVTVRAENGSLPNTLPPAISGDPLRTAIVSPITLTTTQEVIGLLVTGLNPRCDFNAEYELFMHLAVEFIEKAAALISFPAEQKRAKEVSDEINNALAQQLRLTTLKAERSEQKFERLASTAPTGMFMFDGEGKTVYVNDTYLEMLGPTRAELSPRRPDAFSWNDLIHEDDIERFIRAWTRISEEKVPITVEYRLKKPWKSVDKATGQELLGETWLLATAFPDVGSNGAVSFIQGWLTDISHRKFSENLVAQRLEDALENKRQTENFIDMTSHEMRNPLSAILQSADSVVSMLTSDGMPILTEATSFKPSTVEDIVDAAQTIILCAQHQKRIVDDILTLSKLDASLLVMSPDKVQAPTLVTKALKMYEAEIERAGIEAIVCIEPSYEELGIDWVVLDPSRLLQVIINLLTNSVKFTQYAETRKIKICVGASHQKPTGKHHGISFIPARQLRPVQLVLPDDYCGEDIYLQIAVYDTGRGLSEDEMKVLFQRFQQGSPKTYSQYGGSGLGLFISRELCELQGGQIGVASSPGKTVFTFFVKVKRWLSDKEGRPDPRLESVGFTSAAASPVAFSRRGSAVLQDAENPMINQLIKNDGAIVEEFRPNSRKRSLTPTPIPNKRHARQDTVMTNGEAKDIHVLIVEDNLINQKVMSQQLRRAGCTVHTANHGLECLEFLESSIFCSAQTPLHLILLDLEMPTMDGLTCIRHIRERQAAGTIVRHVPVIAVTANARSEQIASAIEAGMDRVVTKPFRIPELVPQMEMLVQEYASPMAPRQNAR